MRERGLESLLQCTVMAKKERLICEGAKLNWKVFLVGVVFKYK